MPFIVAIENVMPLVALGVGKRTRGTRFSQHNQPAKEPETFSLGVNGSCTWRRTSNSLTPSAASWLNGSLSWYVSF
jgi:pyruvate dehydrogenase E2 component (dihydrolipoamide acetyltransferase)